MKKNFALHVYVYTHTHTHTLDTTWGKVQPQFAWPGFYLYSVMVPA